MVQHGKLDQKFHVRFPKCLRARQGFLPLVILLGLGINPAKILIGLNGPRVLADGRLAGRDGEIQLALPRISNAQPGIEFRGGIFCLSRLDE